MICSFDQPALDGIYKLSSLNNSATIKFSENPEKINNPGKKKVVRYLDRQEKFFIDALTLDEEPEADIKLIRHPSIAFQKTPVDRMIMHPEAVVFPVVRDGRQVADFPALQATQAFARDRFAMLPDEHKRFANPHIYRVGLSEKLYDLRQTLIEKRLQHA